MDLRTYQKKRKKHRPVTAATASLHVEEEEEKEGAMSYNQKFGYRFRIAV